MPKRSGRKRGSNAYNPIDVHVGARLRTRRTLLGLSQTVLGNAIGLPSGSHFSRCRNMKKAATV
jgi:hypothetical protein